MRRSLPVDPSAPAFDGSVEGPPSAVEDDAEAKAAFHLRMRTRGIRDLAVLRALELVPRREFVPQRYRDLACRDLPIPIGCGQTLESPWLAARMIEALRVDRDLRVLEIGSGSGYATALLARCGAEVLGVERFKSLAVAADARLVELNVSNASVIWADGLDLPETTGRFDRILVFGALSARPEHLLARLSDAGALICALDMGAGQDVVWMSNAPESTRVIVSGSRLQPIQQGLAAAL